MPNLPGIDHPGFIRVNKTHYRIRNPDSAHQWYVHVGQIMDYLAFDLHIRKHGTAVGFHGIPLGYIDFARSFNTGQYPNDNRTISTVITGLGTGDTIVPSITPVFLDHFHITPEQCGLGPPKRNGVSDAQALVFEDYAIRHAIRNKRKREAYNEREEKRRARFSKAQSSDRFESTTDDGRIPGDDEYNFRIRAKNLADKWRQILNANKPVSPAASTGQANGETDTEDAKDEDVVTNGTKNIDLNGTTVDQGSEEDANADIADVESMLADETMSQA